MKKLIILFSIFLLNCSNNSNDNTNRIIHLQCNKKFVTFSRSFRGNFGIPNISYVVRNMRNNEDVEVYDVFTSDEGFQYQIIESRCSNNGNK